jgi:hypothetical protein
MSGGVVSTAEQVGTAAAAARVAKTAAFAVVATAVFGFSWLFRFNDPGGAFAGLTDDHFFYLVRGWQILFGDLPVRDFVDHGAPLYYYVAALVQWFDRGTLSEVTFSVTALSAGAALTFWLAARASGSIGCGLAAVLVQILLEPRLYNYPKIVVYTIAIPLIWRFADRPSRTLRFWLAAVTVVAFLFRHDHGLFVGIAFATVLVTLGDLHWRDRLRHGLIYAALALALLTPYLAFIQLNGGLRMYFRDASAWAARDRDRAPVVWPGLFDHGPEPTAPTVSTALPTRTVAVVRRNFTAWLFYLELALPLCALAALAVSRDGFRPGWPHAIPKLASVAVLGVALNAGFLRHPLGARLADPSVPHAILLAWLLAAAVRAMVSRGSLREGAQRFALPIRVFLLAATLLSSAILLAGLSDAFEERLAKAHLADGVGEAIDRARYIRRQLRESWQVESWQQQEDRPDLMNLSMYLNACTSPSDRIFIQHYAPQVLALARRAFAGGHADLRPGFFTTVEAQRLTIDRLRHQQVPVVLLETGEGYLGFRESFPLIAAYFDEHYTLAGAHVFDRRFGVQLLVRKDRQPVRTYEPLRWPCFS